MSMKSRILLGCWLVAGLVAVSAVSASVPKTLNFQGVLTDSDGRAASGEKSVVFRFYAAETGGSSLLTLSETVTVDSNGLYSADLDVSSLDFDAQYWLGVEVEEDGEMTPRYKLSGSGYAMYAVRAQDADLLGGESPSYYLDYSNLTNVPAVESAEFSVNLGTNVITEPTKALIFDDSYFSVSESTDSHASVSIDMDADLDMDGNRIVNLPLPVEFHEAASKGYVDAQSGGGNAAVLHATQTFTGLNTFTKLVTVSSNTVITGDLGVGTDLDVIGDATVLGTLDVTGAADLSDNLNVGGDLGVTGDLTAATVTSALTSTGDLDMVSNKIVNLADPDDPQDAVTKAYVDSLTGGGESAAVLSATQTFTGLNTFTKLVTVSSDTVITGDLDVGTDLDVGGDLGVSGALTADTIDTGQGATDVYMMDQNLRTTDAVEFASVNTGQGAHQLFEMDQDVTTGSVVTFSTLTITESAEIQFDLDVMGDAVVSGTLDVTGSADLSDNLNVGGDLDVTGALTADTVTSALTSTGELDMDSNKIVNLVDPDDDQDAATKAYVDSLTGGGENAAVLSGTQTFTGQNTFTKLVTVSSDTVVTGDLGVGTDLEVAGDATVAGSLDVSGALTADNATVSVMTATQGASVGGNLNVDEDTTVGGTLDVAGAVDFAGNLDVGGDLDVTGALTADTIDTGWGVTDVYMMDQDVTSTSEVMFATVTVNEWAWINEIGVNELEALTANATNLSADNGEIDYLTVTDGLDSSDAPITVSTVTANDVTGLYLLDAFGGGVHITENKFSGGNLSVNTVTGNYAFAWGDDNTASGNHSVVSGGEENEASGMLSTVGGGFQNVAAGSGYTTVGGGINNTASSYDSTVSGGKGNTASGEGSAIGGGQDNTATADAKWAAIGGGHSNEATANYATVAGGRENVASEQDATVSGGFGNEATAMLSTVGGGNYNVASGQAAVVPGGTENTASGNYSAVLGGWQNVASGAHSFAAGMKSSATAVGAWAISDSVVDENLNDIMNSFRARFQGGFDLIGGAPGEDGSIVRISTGNSVSGITTMFEFMGNGDAVAEGTWTSGGADFSEWFRKDIGEVLEPGDVIGLNLDTGMVRRYQEGDVLVGVYSTKPGFVGNNIPDELKSDYALVALVGQVPYKADQVSVSGRRVETSDGKRIGYLLEDGNVFLRVE